MRKSTYGYSVFGKIITYFVVGVMVLGALAVTGIQIVQAAAKINNLFQCDPPTVFDPLTYTCATSSATGWVTGNNDGPYTEGQVVPYRTHLSGLTPGTNYYIRIEWDTTKASKHATDYIASYNETIKSTDACASLTDLPTDLCTPAPSTFPIPEDIFMTSQTDWITNGGVRIPGVFSAWGGTIFSLGTPGSEYTPPASYVGDTSTSINIYFTANSTDVVMAWGGHIAERKDWGNDSSAVTIKGSPYHMRIKEFREYVGGVWNTLNVGNTDRSLSAEAVIYPATIRILKVTNPQPNFGTFSFTASPAPISNFALPTNGDVAAPYTKTFSGITTFQTYTITESIPTGWTLTNIVCAVESANGGSQAVNVGTATSTIGLKEGEVVTCTYTNTAPPADAAISKTCNSIPTSDPYYRITVTSAGPGAAAGAQITDALPVGVTYNYFTSQLVTNNVAANQGSCSNVGTNLTCDLNTALTATTVDPTSKWVVDVHFNFASYDDLQYMNTANLSTTTTDSNQANNVATAACELPLAVDMLGFSATAGAKRVVTLNWETENEVDNLGFNLYRATSETGQRTKLNNIMIPNLVSPGSMVGAIYTYVDTDFPGKPGNGEGSGTILRQAKNGRTYYYWLESVSIYGGTELMGPVEAQVLNK